MRQLDQALNYEQSKSQLSLSQGALSGSPDASQLASLCDEYTNRLQAGDNPTIEEYIEAHPQLEPEIRLAFAALGMMNVISDSEPKGTLEEIPERIGRFEIVREIGSGGMGIVYEVTHPFLSRRIALKVLKPHRSTHELRARFVREAEAASRLTHPNIVPLIDYGEEEGISFLTMVYIEGVSLDHLLHRHWSRKSTEPETHQTYATPFIARDFDAVARIGADVAGAVAHAHANGTIHRDIKPGNLILDESGKIWVTDFGLAKICDHDLGFKSVDDVPGTPKYMAPEQFQGVANERTDVYSLGITLYELATGDCISRDKCNPLNDAVIDSNRVMAANPMVPAELADIITRACAFSPRRRFQSASELQFALNQFVHGDRSADRRARLRRSSSQQKYLVRVVALLCLLMVVVFGVRSWDAEFAPVTQQPTNEAPARSQPPETIEHTELRVGVVEGSQAIPDVWLTASDPDGNPFSWQLADSPDAAAFLVQSMSGRLCLKKSPQYSAPMDTNGDNVLELTLQATEARRPHVQLYTADVLSGALAVREPSSAGYRKCHLPRRLLSVCSNGQSILHAHLSADGAVSLYQSSNEQSETALLQPNCGLSPLIRGLAQGPDSTFLSIVESPAGFNFQWLTLNDSNVFEKCGDAFPLDDTTNPVALSGFGNHEFQLLEVVGEVIKVSELAILGDVVIARRALHTGWHCDDHVLGMTAWNETTDAPQAGNAIRNIRVEIIPKDHTSGQSVDSIADVGESRIDVR